MSFRPLFSRDKPDPRFDGPQRGLPDYLFEPVKAWVVPLLWVSVGSANPAPHVERLRAIQTALRVEKAFDWNRGGHSAVKSLIDRMWVDREFALEVVDYLLHTAGRSRVESLNQTLYLGGSEWEAQALPDGSAQLAKRALGPVSESIDAIRGDSERAHHHLMTAWARLMGRDPDPSTAYREAVKAVEVVAKPVVSPHNDRATLGTIIRDIRAKPEKWTVELEASSPELVAVMADAIWKGQIDRHGSDDENVPLAVSQEEADVAVHIAISLVRLFAGGLIRPRQ